MFCQAKKIINDCYGPTTKKPLDPKTKQINFQAIQVSKSVWKQNFAPIWTATDILDMAWKNFNPSKEIKCYNRLLVEIAFWWV